MGMGEPLANYPRLSRTLDTMISDWGMGISPRRITVSTVGLVPTMERLLTEFQVNLAVSLHATTDETRDRIAPINRRYPIADLLGACRELPLQRRAPDHFRICDAATGSMIRPKTPAAWSSCSRRSGRR